MANSEFTGTKSLNFGYSSLLGIGVLKWMSDEEITVMHIVFVEFIILFRYR